VLASAANLHNFGFFSFTAIFAAILAVLFGRTIASRMRTLAGFFISHEISLLVLRGDSIVGDKAMLGAIRSEVKAGIV
jgi:hypothetical protein